MSHLTQLFERLDSYGPRDCIKDGAQSYTYAQLLHAVESWSKRLDELGVAPGAVVGVRSDYSLSAIAVLLALFRRQAIAALIPTRGALDTFLSDSLSTALLDLSIDGRYEWHLTQRRDGHPLLEALRSAEDGGFVLFTSGSTGRPKAALQSIERFLSKFQRPGRCLCTLAFFLLDHIGGFDTLFHTLANGGVIVVTRRRDPHSILTTIATHGVEVLPTSPSFLRLVCVGRGYDQDLSSLKIITYGAETMDADTLARVNSLFPNAEIQQRYGTTETGSPSTSSRAKDSLWVSFKRHGIETKVVDDVLWIRSDSSMLGYLNAPNPLDGLGWYCTGDMVDLDGEWIKFRGRVSDVINVGGEKVSPVEIERVILQLDFIRNAMVRGEPHPLLGQIATAKVELSEVDYDRKKAVRLIREHCRGKLAPHKVPVKIEVVTGGLANDRQKIQRRSEA